MMKPQQLFTARRWRRAALLLPLLAFGAAVLWPSAEAQEPKQLRRADSLLDIHFDFHAGMDCTNVGAHTTPAMIGNIIDLVHPDYTRFGVK